MENNPVDWFEIYVDDLNRASKFYEAVLGVKLSALDSGDVNMRVFPMGMNRPGAAGALVHMDGFPAGGNSTLVYFFSEDCAVEQRRVTENGGQIQKPKQSIGEHGFISLVIDTEGNMFGLHSMK